MADNEEVLRNLKTNLHAEKLEIQNSIHALEVQIDEIRSYIDDLGRKNDSDLSLFSPRAVAKDYTGEIESKKKEIEDLEEELRGLYKKLATVTKQLDSLTDVKIKDADDPEVDDFKMLFAKKLATLDKNNTFALKYLESNPTKARQYLQKNAEIIAGMEEM